MSTFSSQFNSIVSEVNPLTDEDIENTRFNIAQNNKFAQIANASDDFNFVDIGLATVAAGIDTVLSSVTPMDDNATEKFLERNAPGAANALRAHEDGIRFAGDLITSFIPGALAIKAVRMGGVANKAAKGIFGKRLDKDFVLSTGKSNRELLQPVMEQAAILRSKRVIDFNNPVNTKFLAEKKKFFKRTLTDTIVENIAVDAAIAVTMNESEVFFPPEYTVLDNLIFFGGFNALLGLGAGAVARASFKRNVQKAIKGKVKGEDLYKTNNYPGARGEMLTVSGLQLENLRNAANASDGSVDPTAVKQQISASEKQAAEGFIALANDTQYKNITQKYNLADGSGTLGILQKALREDPHTFLNSMSLEEFSEEGLKNFERDLIGEKITLNNELFELRAKFDGGKLSDKAQKEVSVEIAANEKMQARLNSAVQTVIELDGTSTVAAGRKAMFQDGDRIIKRSDEVSIAETVEGTVKVDKVGNVEMPASITAVAKPIAVEATSRIADIDPKALANSMGFGTTQKLLDVFKQQVVGAVSPIIASSELKRLQQSFKTSALTVYTRADQPGTASLTKTKKHNKAQTISVDAIMGLTKAKNLIIEQRDFAPISAETFASASYFQKTAIYDTLQHSAEQVNIETLPKIAIQEGDHFTKLDYVIKLYEEFDQQLLNKLDGIVDMDQIQYMSLKSKFETHQHMRYANGEKFAKGLEPENDLTQLAKNVNLPTEMRTLVEMFESAMLEKKEGLIPFSFFGKDLEEFKNTIKTHAGGTDADEILPDLQLVGNMLNLSREGKPVRNISENQSFTKELSKQNILERAFIERNAMLTRLDELIKTQPGAGIVAAVKETFDRNAAIVKSIKQNAPDIVAGLDNSDSVLSQAVTTAFISRGVPGAPAYNVIGDLIFKASQKQLDNLLVQHKDVFNGIIQSKSPADLTSFFVARASFGQGWDIKTAKSLQSPTDGKPLFQYVLDSKTARNRTRWQSLFGTKMPANALVPTVGKIDTPLTVTQKAHSAIESFDALTNASLADVNILQVAQNKRPFAKKQFHLPPQNLAGKEVVYLLDSTGEVVHMQSARTLKQANALAQQAVESAAKRDKTLIAVPENAVANYNHARGRAFYELNDYSSVEFQTGAAKGTSYSDIISQGPEEFQEMLELTMRHFTDTARQATKVLFEPDLRYLQFKNLSVSKKESDSTIFNVLRDQLLGISGVNANTGLGKLQNAVSDNYDLLMEGIADSKVLKSLRVFEDKKSQKAFDNIEATFGKKFNPFNDFNDYLERTANIKLPGTLKKHAAALNEITASLAIRMGDIGMMSINIISLGSTLPVVIKSLGKLTDESDAEQFARIGVFTDKTPAGLNTINPTKVVTSGIHFQFSAEGQRVVKLADSMGYLDQAAAEQVKTYGQVGEKYITGVLRNFSDVLSKPVDWSEKFARTTSFMSFYNMGKNMMKLDETASMAFAHMQANQVIADFRPSNRPGIFRGAAGMPFGLFTTYMWNFLQRLYSNVENKQIGALVNQVGLQTFLFGAETLPGAEGFINHFASNQDGSQNIIDTLNKSIGFEATSAIMNGSISTLSDAGGFGLSIGPRAAIGLPGSQGFDAQSAAGIRMMMKVGKGIGEVIDNVQQNQGLDFDEMATIVGKMNINKFSSNMIELATGTAVDSQNNVIESNTRTLNGSVARAFGFKPFFADELRQENRRNRATDKHRAALKARLAFSLQAKARSGELSTEAVDGALGDYIKAGGTPENFKRYFNSQILKAHTNKLNREISDALKLSFDQNRVARLLVLYGE